MVFMGPLLGFHVRLWAGGVFERLGLDEPPLAVLGLSMSFRESARKSQHLAASNLRFRLVKNCCPNLCVYIYIYT